MQHGMGAVVVVGHRHVQGQAGLDLVVPGEEAAQGVAQAVGFDCGQVAEVAEVDPEDRDPLGADQVDGPQHRAVPAQAHGQVEGAGHRGLVAGRRVHPGVEHLADVALVVEPGDGVGREADGAGPLAVGDEADDRHIRGPPSGGGRGGCRGGWVLRGWVLRGWRWSWLALAWRWSWWARAWRGRGLVDGSGDLGGGGRRFRPDGGGTGNQVGEELDVAVGAPQRRDHDPHHGRSGGAKGAHHRIEGLLPHLRVADHPSAPGRLAASRFELWFH